jgi:hypothetical protein
MFADELSDETIEATLTAMKNTTSPFSLVQFRGLRGAMARVGKDATACRPCAAWHNPQHTETHTISH